MKKFSKYTLSIFAIVAVFMVSVLLTACGNGISVKLYDNATLVKTVKVEKDKTYNLGKITKTGYTFLGWYTENGGGCHLPTQTAPAQA